MRSSVWSKLVALGVGCGAILVIAAILFPIFATPKESMGPSLIGAAEGATFRMETYYRDRPGRISAWASRSGAPSWMDGRESGRGGWRYLASKLKSEEAELTVAPNAIGRRWSELRSEDPILLLTYRKKPPVEIKKIDPKSSARPRSRARLSQP